MQKKKLLHDTSYLERYLNRIVDPYEVAMVAYALSLVNSPAKETAFGLLHTMQRKHGIITFIIIHIKYSN